MPIYIVKPMKMNKTNNEETPTAPAPKLFMAGKPQTANPIIPEPPVVIPEIKVQPSQQRPQRRLVRTPALAYA